FNLSEKYRIPVLIMTDAEVGHMTEKVVIPPPEEVEIVNRPQVRRGDVEPDHFRIYRDSAKQGDGYISPMVAAGEGYRIHVTGLTHDERGYPVMNARAHEWNVSRLMDKIRKHRDDIIRVEEENTDDAEVVVVSYGISARTSLWPIQRARQEGIRVGYLRLITVWPFPEERIRQLAKGIRAFVAPEINMGQMAREVERCAAGQAQVWGANIPGGDVLDPHLVLNVIRQAAGRPAKEEHLARAAEDGEQE
ncbi:MAG: 2-oxoacid:acceptor oxidoreductase subunit alpha, partial [Chloroflexota bacterium]